MKKLFFIAFLFTATASFAQPSPPQGLRKYDIFEVSPETESVKEDPKKTESDWGKYVSFSTSFSNQDGLSTLQSAYSTLEVGVYWKNLSGGLGLGKTLQASYLENGNTDPLSVSYFLEPRFVWNVLDLTVFKAGVIGGFGVYLDPSKTFIREYGVGTEVDTKYVNYALQFTNWGTGSVNANYLSIGISKTF